MKKVSLANEQKTTRLEDVLNKMSDTIMKLHDRVEQIEQTGTELAKKVNVGNRTVIVKAPEGITVPETVRQPEVIRDPGVDEGKIKEAIKESIDKLKTQFTKDIDLVRYDTQLDVKSLEKELKKEM